jgi:LacI family transcriptional regulator
MNKDGRAGRAVTITDVAEAAGVSVRTVSRVLNSSPKVGETTRVQVQGQIDRLGFQPSLGARALASGRSLLLGVVQDDPNAHVIGVFQRGIVEVCSELGYELLVHPAKSGDPDLVRNIEDFVRRTRVDGLVLLPPVSESPNVAVALAELNTPAVAIASVRVPAYPAMLVGDEREGAALVGEHLHALGHRRIAMITGPRRFWSATEREQGFRASLGAHGLQLPPAYVFEGDYGFESGLAATERLLALPEPPTAIFASNDIMAAGVLKFAADRRLRAPEDLSVAGFDDSDVASMLSPGLTTVHRPFRSMARAATERLMTLIGGGLADHLPDLRMPLHLVVRGSTGPARS